MGSAHHSSDGIGPSSKWLGYGWAQLGDPVRSPAQRPAHKTRPIDPLPEMGHQIHTVGYIKVVPSSYLYPCEFDGASRGNPGWAGAGAILRAEDGSKIYRLREGVGFTTNNIAEYRALILGLKQANRKGYKHIHVQGDSQLVCNQIQGVWNITSQNLIHLYNEAMELTDKFQSFSINHVPRQYNTEADYQANLAANLQDGQVEEDRELLY